MFPRTLTRQEIETIREIERFVRVKHQNLTSHDYSHVLAVTNHAVEIATQIDEPIDPFVLICGALFHDIGRVAVGHGQIHGLLGATIAEEYLKAIGIARDIRRQIVRIIVRHTETSRLPPETAAEKVVFDADDLERLGLMGMLRGMMVGDVERSMESIIDNRLEKRKKDYSRLHFEASRSIGRNLYEETLQLIDIIRSSMDQRYTEISRLKLPVTQDP